MLNRYKSSRRVMHIESGKKKKKSIENESVPNDRIIEKYCALAIEKGVTDAKLVIPSSVETAAWVRWKCRFGCPVYGQGHCCPPDTPTPEETRKFLDSYQRAILFHLQVPQSPVREERKELGKTFRKLHRMLVKMEGELFKEGFYKAFLFLAGPCRMCKECGKVSGEPCLLMGTARPAMEACGIDVFQTARNNDYYINPLHDKTETQNTYCLMMVD
ncbi:MAG: DUF2284 domain-containing protein [Deltaproteobacteria bacterium]|nr:DUF2284 domain-containing protein [Deltaproteobacteria bacterium]MBT4641736.1 DUF2284 domain-containing protein [Deltaproteobacteria bacterium]MBT6502078.1 DUF2284 domain-containing protein [Deltaproteobacteria bacterium]MBT7151540.1 DUF2284 domain-containing protein [Deltaproteobacteria bacterium]MBT7713651.1 DUF2284 domain-containing protein [Deltaproteobacteria bacterium]